MEIDIFECQDGHIHMFISDHGARGMAIFRDTDTLQNFLDVCSLIRKPKIVTEIPEVFKKAFEND